MTGILIGLMTHPDRMKLEKLLELAAENHLIACGNILTSPITSIYTWEGKTHKEPEALVIFKTTTEKAEACMQFFKDSHPYTCPEILFLPVESGFPGYLKWVKDVCNKPKI